MLVKYMFSSRYLAVLFAFILRRERYTIVRLEISRHRLDICLRRRG